MSRLGFVAEKKELCNYCSFATSVFITSVAIWKCFSQLSLAGGLVGWSIPKNSVIPLSQLVCSKSGSLKAQVAGTGRGQAGEVSDPQVMNKSF